MKTTTTTEKQLQAQVLQLARLADWDKIETTLGRRQIEASGESGAA